MTDNEIIKALENCADGSGTGLIRATIDLISRQKAEIERLNTLCADCSMIRGKTETISKLKEQIEYWQRGYNNLRQELKTARTEAIKEFAERLKEFQKPVCFDEAFIAVDVEDIDRLVKELTGGK